MFDSGILISIIFTPETYFRRVTSAAEPCRSIIVPKANFLPTIDVDINDFFFLFIKNYLTTKFWELWGLYLFMCFIYKYAPFLRSKHLSTRGRRLARLTISTVLICRHTDLEAYL